MPPKKTGEDNKERVHEIIAQARREQEQRQRGHRAQALKIFPWVCGRCGREFEGQRLRELTVHHKDHNHDNNPPDGSNWELLCLYCHDNEHSQHIQRDWHDGANPISDQTPHTTFRPFANLDALLKDEE